PAPGCRERVQELYTAEIGVQEATGRNDGPRIAEYLRCVGLGPGHPWCAAFVCYILGKAGADNPKNGWSPALFPAKRIIWNKDQALAQRPTPQPGDVFGLYSPEQRRINHCGFVDYWGDTWVITVEGNVENAVVRKRRSVKSMYQVAK